MNKFLLLCLVFCLPGAVLYAQWNGKTLLSTPGLRTEIINSVTDEEKSFFVSMHSLREGRFSTEKFQNIYVQKVNSEGVIQWPAGGVKLFDTDTTVYDEEQEEYVFNSLIVPGGAGGAIVCWKKNEKIYMQRIDVSGNRIFPGEGKLLAALMPEPRNMSSYRYTISTDHHGGFYIAYFQDLGPLTQPELFLDHLDQDGNSVFPPGRLKFPSGLNNAAAKVSLVSYSNSVALCWDTVAFDQSDTLERFQVRRIDAQGNNLWENKIIYAPHGKFVLDGETLFVNDGLMVQKVSPDGVNEWGYGKQFAEIPDGFHPDWAYNIVPNGSGGVYCFYSYGQTAFAFQAHIANMDTNGNILWDRTISYGYSNVMATMDNAYGAYVMLSPLVSAKITHVDSSGTNTWNPPLDVSPRISMRSQLHTDDSNVVIIWGESEDWGEVIQHHGAVYINKILKNGTVAEVPDTIQIEYDSIHISKQPQEIRLGVNGNKNWFAQAEYDLNNGLFWANVNGTQWQRNDTVITRIDFNPLPENRTADIVIRTARIEKRMRIIQEPNLAPDTLFIDEDTLRITRDEQRLYVLVQSNTMWRLRPLNVSWFNAWQTNPAGDDSMEIWIGAMTELGKRETDLIIYTVTGTISDTIHIIQGEEEQPTGISKISDVLKVNIYPNPSSGSFTLTYSLQKPTYVKAVLYDLLGRPVQTVIDERAGSGEQEISFEPATLTGGFYFLRLSAGNETLTYKIQYIR